MFDGCERRNGEGWSDFSEARQGGYRLDLRRSLDRSAGLGVGVLNNLQEFVTANVSKLRSCRIVSFGKLTGVTAPVRLPELGVQCVPRPHLKPPLGDSEIMTWLSLKHQSIGIGPESDTIAYFYRTHSLDQLRVCKAYTELASSSITFYW